MSEAEVSFPAMNVLWPAKETASLEAAARAASKVWTINPVSEHEFAILSEDYQESGQDRTKAAEELRLPTKYIELARMYLLAWNRAIYSYLDPGLVISKNARDPEFRAKYHLRVFLRCFLVAHYDIWRILREGDPTVLVGYAAYRFNDVGLAAPFPPAHREWWVSVKDNDPNIIFPRELMIAKSDWLGDEEKYVNEADQANDAIDHDGVFYPVIGFHHLCPNFGKTLLKHLLQKYEEDPSVNNNGRTYQNYLRLMDKQKARGEINFDETLALDTTFDKNEILPAPNHPWAAVTWRYRTPSSDPAGGP